MQCEGTNNDGTSCRKMVTYSGWNTGSDGGLYCHHHRQNLGLSLSSISSRLLSSRTRSYCIGRRSIGEQCRNITKRNKFCQECRYQKLIPEKFRIDYFWGKGVFSDGRLSLDENGEIVKTDSFYYFDEEGRELDYEGMQIYTHGLISKGKFVGGKFVFGNIYYLDSCHSLERNFDVNGNGRGIERREDIDGNSEIFEGEYVNENRHGKGNVRNTNGEYKDGEWKHGEFWKGRVGINDNSFSPWFDSEHRSFFESEWDNGKPWSGVSQTLVHKVHFTGEFSSGKKNGNGVFDIDEIMVIGVWDDDVFISGELMISENYDIAETIVNIPLPIKEKLSNDFDENTCPDIQKYFGKTGYGY